MLELKGPDGPIRAHRDALGYPRIEARTTNDSAWARGWFHAMDRQAQCQLTLLVGRGRLMECLGDNALTRMIDRWVRALDLERGLSEAVTAWRPETRRYVQAYCDGFNAGLDARGRPFVLTLLRQPCARWTPENALLTYRVLCFFGLTSQQMMAEVAVAELVADGVSRQLLAMLLGDAAPDPSFDLEGLRGAQFRNEERMLPVGLGGSNAIAVEARRSATGGALLLGDPHMEIGRFPPLMYISHSSCEEGPSYSGAGVPGFPFLSVGRTEHLATTYTFAHGDNVDVRFDEVRDHRRKAGDTWEPIERRIETVTCGKRRTETWVYGDTPFGTLMGDPEIDGRYPCIRWCGLREGGSDLDAFHEALYATDCAGFVAAHRKVSTISVAGVVADTKGDVAYVQTGRVERPSRGEGGAYPWDGSGDAVGEPPRADERTRPVIEAPPTGVIVTANERTDGPDATRWITLPEPGYRQKRLTDLVENHPQVRPRDLVTATYDHGDLCARRLLAVWEPLLPDDPLVSRMLRWASRQGDVNPPWDADAIGHFHALHHETVLELLTQHIGREKTERLFEHLSLTMNFQHHLDDALALERPTAVNKQELAKALQVAWPRAKERYASGEWSTPVRRPFKNIFTEGKEPRLLGFSSDRIELRGGPTSPFQARIMQVAGQDMVGGSACHLVFDMSKPGGWYNICGGASERRLGPGYGKGLDSWAAGRFLPLGDPTGMPPNL